MKYAIALAVLTVRIAHADVIAIDVTLNGDQRTAVDETLAGTSHRVITFSRPEQIVAATKRDRRVIVVSERALGMTTLGDKLAASGIAMTQVGADALSKLLEAPKRGPITVVFVLDRGFSMRGMLPAAKQLVRDVVGHLPPDDRVGLVTFESEVETPVPLTRDKGTLFAGVHRVQPGVGGILFAGLRTAHDALGASPRKHVIVISDGDGVMKDGVPELVEDMQDAGARITLVVAGPDIRWMPADETFDLTKQAAAQIGRRLRDDLRPD